MKRLIAGLMVAAAFAPTALAQAACVPATTPPVFAASEALLPQPAIPSCVDMVAKKSACTQPVADAYNAAMKAYLDQHNARIDALNAYTAKLNTFIGESNAYAKCEQARALTFAPTPRTDAPDSIAAATAKGKQRPKNVGASDDGN